MWCPATSLQQPPLCSPVVLSTNWAWGTQLPLIPHNEGVGERLRDEYRPPVTTTRKEYLIWNSRDRKTPSRFWVWPCSSVCRVGGKWGDQEEQERPRSYPAGRSHCGALIRCTPYA